MGNETLLFHGSNSGLEVLGLCTITGEPLGSRGIYQNGLNSGEETSMTTDPRYAIHWGYDVLLVSSLEKAQESPSISKIWHDGATTYKFKGSLDKENIGGIFLDSLQLSFVDWPFIEKIKEHFPNAKVFPYSPDIHTKEGNLPQNLFQNIF